MARRIESLEAKQKVHLFDRLHTGYSLTPAGEVLLQLVARMEPTFRPFKCHSQNKLNLNIISSTLERQSRGTAVLSDDYHRD